MEYRKGRDDGTQEGRRNAWWDTGKEGIVGHRRGRGTARWDTGKEKGLPAEPQERKRDCQVGHRKGRGMPGLIEEGKRDCQMGQSKGKGTARWDTGREERLPGGR